MSRQGHTAATVTDYNAAMTAFDEKPLPPIQDLKDRPLPLASGMHEGRPKSGQTGRGSHKAKKASSKNSLFSLFSRPKVEKLRGYAEPGLSLAPIQESKSVINSRAHSPEPRPRKTSSDRPYPYRPGTGMSFRARDRSKVSRSSMDGRGSSGSEGPRPLVRRRSSWVPPPLFQAFAQSIKVSKAQTIDGAGPLQVSRLRRDSQDSSRKGDESHHAGSIASTQYSGLPRKIFSLTPSGHMLQYTDQGLTGRLPERVLQLTSDSLAFVCDLVPGEPYVLQIASSTDVKDIGLPSSVSLLSRIGLRGSLARKETPNLYMVFRTALEMDEWLVAIREKIEDMGVDVNPFDSDEEDEGEEKKTQQEAKIEKVEKEKDKEKERKEEPVRQNIFRFPKRRISAIDMIAPEEEASTPEEPTLPLDNLQESFVNAPRSRRSRTPSLADSSTSPQHSLSPTKSRADTTEGSKPVSSIHSSTPRDSPMSPCDSDSAGKQFPFKIRASLIDGASSSSGPLPAPKPAFATPPTSSYNSPSHTPRNTQVFEFPAADPEQRPDSIVTDLPTIKPSRAVSRTRTPSPASAARIHARQTDPKLRPLRTAEPSQPRQADAKPFVLPLKVKVPVNVSGSTSKESPIITSTPTSASSASGSPATGFNRTPVVPPTPTSSHHPRRTSSVKLSLFPSASPPIPTPVPHRPVTPKDRSLRRPASLQVNTNPAPFASSIRPGNGTRQPLKKTPSTPSLRSAPGMPPLRQFSSDYKFTTSSSDLSGNAFIASRSASPLPGISATPALPPLLKTRQSSKEPNENMTALPPPRSRSRLDSASNISSVGLPALDLGIPVIGLAPPAPPPNRGLPSLPEPPAVPPKVTAHRMSVRPPC